MITLNPKLIDVVGDEQSHLVRGRVGQFYGGKPTLKSVGTNLWFERDDKLRPQLAAPLVHGNLLTALANAWSGSRYRELEGVISPEPLARRNIFHFPPGKKRQPNAIIRGKNHLDCTRKGRAVVGGSNRCPKSKISCPSLHTCDSTSEAVGLFTSCSHPISLALGLRLQIRNRFSTSQEKIGILFSFSVQKNLDEKRFSDGPIFSLVRVPLTSFGLVRQDHLISLR